MADTDSFLGRVGDVTRQLAGGAPALASGPLFAAPSIDVPVLAPAPLAAAPAASPVPSATEFASARAAASVPADDLGKPAFLRRAHAPAAMAAPVSSPFRAVFWTVVALTVAAGIAEIVMAQVWQTPTGQQQAVFGSMDFAWKAGIGAIIGLIGGKAA